MMGQLYKSIHRIAIHEAGHVAACPLPGFGQDSLGDATIMVEGTDREGHTQIKEGFWLQSPNLIRDRAVVAISGIASEKLYCMKLAGKERYWPSVTEDKVRWWEALRIDNPELRHDICKVCCLDWMLNDGRESIDSDRNGRDEEMFAAICNLPAYRNRSMRNSPEPYYQSAMESLRTNRVERFVRSVKDHFDMYSTTECLPKDRCIEMWDASIQNGQSVVCIE
jgi:hypothetical protein